MVVERIIFVFYSLWLFDIPYYNQDPELIMDIMKHGSGVEVLAPAALKNRVRDELQKAILRYQ